MKLCVFQGTVNPIHKAHLTMADFVLKNYDFDKIFFIPAFKPPHKDYDENLTPHRLQMVKLATQFNPKFEVLDIEYKNDRKSYTYLTILELYKMFQIDGKINFIIGTDAFEKIESWYEINNLKKLVKFLVFPRENLLDTTKFDALKLKGYDFEFMQMRFEDISSTQVRNGEIKNFVTKEVEEYIDKNGLYK